MDVSLARAALTSLFGGDPRAEDEQEDEVEASSDAEEEVVQEPGTAPVATTVAQPAVEESQGLNLMPPEGSLASPRASSEVGELDAEEELNAEEELCTEGSKIGGRELKFSLPRARSG